MSSGGYGSVAAAAKDGEGDESTTPRIVVASADATTNEKAPLLTSTPATITATSDDRNYWDRLTFGWMAPLFELGNTKDQLDFADATTLPLPEDCETDAVYGIFSKYWSEEMEGHIGGGNEGGNNGSDGRGWRFWQRRRDGAQREEGSDGSNGDDGDGLEDDDSTSKLDHYPSLVHVMYRAYGREFLEAGLLKFVHDTCIFVGPQVLNRLIAFLRDADAPMSEGLILLAVVTASQLLMSFCLRHYFYKCYCTGLRVRTAVVAAVYRKSLALSSKERHARGGAGEIANLVGIDAQRMQDLMTYLHAVWYSFLQIALAIYFLWGQVGASCLAGVVVILVLIPLTKFVASWLASIQKRLMAARDARVNLNNEVLGAMKVIKIQAWEESFKSKLTDLREIELSNLKYYFLANALSIMLWSCSPLLVALSTFATYTLSGHNLDVAEALTALALFEILRFPLFMFPQIINRMVEAGISFERVRTFLLAEEHVPVGEGSLQSPGEIHVSNGTFVYDSKQPRLPEGDVGGSSGGGIRAVVIRHRRMMEQAALDRKWEMMLLKAQLTDAESRIRELESEHYPRLLQGQEEDGSSSIEINGGGGSGSKVRSANNNADNEADAEEGGKWSPSSLLSLRRVCLECKRGEFVAVVGAVGSGKSTLINSILGEGRALQGTGLAVRGKLAAFAQTPFIMNDTVRNNILFGHSEAVGGADGVDEKRYQLALKACSLSHDLNLLSHGDRTEIGEKGITLSGGQKARVALARAVYHDADVYLLDDPIAAVDAHVGRDLFHKCIVDELLLGKSKGKTGKHDGDGGRNRNATVVLVTNAIQYLSHPMVDRIVCLKDGCVEEVGTFSQLSSDPHSRFSSLLAVMAETSRAAAATVDEEDEDTAAVCYESGSEAGAPDNLSVSGLGDVADEPEVAKIMLPKEIPDFGRKMNRRGSNASSCKERGLSISSEIDDTGKVGGEDGVDEKKSGGALMTDEFQEREKGSVDRKVYVAWAVAGGGLWIGLIIIAMFLLVEGINVISKWWLTHWSLSGGSNEVYFLGIYAAINFGAVFATFCRIVFIMLACLRASRTLFDRLLDVVMHAPMAFFDTTPVGRIINRFSKDMYTIDEQLGSTLRSYLATMMSVLGTIFVISTVTPFFILALAPIIAFYLVQQNYFTKTYRELKRLDSVSRSPIYALLSETLDGVLTIRAFSAEDKLYRRMVAMLDSQQNAYYLTYSSQCWLAVRLELAGTLIILFACLCSVLQHRSRGGDEIFAGLAGLSISYALSVTQSLNWTVRMSSDLEANMVAVERIKQYSALPSEAPRHTSTDDSLPSNWPEHGRIDFTNAKLRYRPRLPLVLKGLDLAIPGKSKIGVVGRTGAGKSTLMVSLLRIVELDSGCIKIDGVDIRNVGLTRLRSKIAVIPQDPVLFSGTVRSNLDPFDDYQDDKLLEAVRRVGLYVPMERTNSITSLGSMKSANSDQGGGRSRAIKSLSDEVFEGGSNFSVGQRQLLVIARAMLSGASIVIMDEATASVDADTDARIQRVLREEFKDATCITVAHRLNTIMDSDFVLVMDDGKVAEFDKPSVLLSREGMFKSLVDAWEEEN